MRPLVLKGHERPLTRVRLNQQGDLLFSSSKDKWICVWFTDNGERLGTYDGHNGAVWDVDVSWDTKILVSASADTTVKVWDVETGACRGTFQNKSTARSIGLSFSGNLIAYTTQGQTSEKPYLNVVDIRERHRPIDLSAEPNFVMQQMLNKNSTACLFSHLDDTIALGDDAGTLHMYDVRKGGDAVNFSQAHSYAVRDLQSSPDQGFLISSSADKTAQLHNARDFQQLKTYKSQRPVNSAAISPTREHIILGGGEEAMQVTQTATSVGQFESKLYHMIFAEEFARFPGHFGPINSLAFGPTGTLVVSGSEDGTVRLQELDQSYLDYEFE